VRLHVLRDLSYVTVDNCHFGRPALDAAHCQPGEPAPETGWYQLLNVFGTPTGERVFIEIGTPSPDAPRGHEWQLISQD
jgi:hypothetical protein